jgi:hypothetical protein
LAYRVIQHEPEKRYCIMGKYVVEYDTERGIMDSIEKGFWASRERETDSGQVGL